MLPSQSVIDAMHAAVESGMHLYPDPECIQLKQAIAKYYAISAECVFVGNGSDEVLAHVFAGLFDADKPLVCPDISYSFYPVYAKMYDLTLQQIALDAQFAINLQTYPVDNGGVVFANPNAPTSIALEVGQIEAFLQCNQNSTVVVDEAYVDFGAQSCVELVRRYTNLLVVQTVSKSRSLAGLRVGFAIGSPELIEGLERIKNSFNSYPLDRVALAGARAAFEDVQAFENARAEIMRVRDQSKAALSTLDFEVLESATNFLFTKPRFMSAEALYIALKKAGILVRYFDAPRISEYLRITVGTAVEMEALVNQIDVIKSKI